MTDADQNHPPSDLAPRTETPHPTNDRPGRTAQRAAPSFRSSFSTLVSGVIALGALGLARALI
ncbi:MAG: hypothetical protein AAF531_08100, partial [Actinomycetota bacterium]